MITYEREIDSRLSTLCSTSTGDKVRYGLSIFLVIILFGSSAFAEWNRTSGLIDIPTAKTMPANVARASSNWFFTFGQDSLHSMDADFSLSYGIMNRAELSAYMLTSKDYAASIAFKITDENGAIPALGLGIQDITASQWISSLGSGDTTGFSDDVDYLTVSKRNPERFSAYLVATKTLGRLGEYTLGIGRGRFVGYGPRSQAFNSDMFFGGGRDTANQHLDAVGLFMGGKVQVVSNLYALGEFDGRDVNVGLSYEHPLFSVHVAMTHVEQLTTPAAVWSVDHHARLAMGISANTSFIRGAPSAGILAGSVTDVATGAPLVARISLVGTGKPSIKTERGAGIYAIHIEPGTYVVRVVAEGYKWKQVTARVLSGKTTALNIALSPKIPPAVVQEIKRRLNDGYNYYLAGNYRRAISEWSRVQELNPGNKKAKDYLNTARQKVAELIASLRSSALTYEGEGRLGMAVSKWNEVLSLDPLNKEAKTSIASLRARVAAKKPKPRPKPKPKPKPRPKPKPKPTVKQPSKEEIEATYKAGVSLYLSGKYKQAISKFQQVLKANPNHSGAKNYLQKARARLKAIEG